MSELIERQAAIDLINGWFKRIGLNGDICVDGLRQLPSAHPRMLTETERLICKMYLDDMDKYKSCNEYKILQGLLDGYIVPIDTSAQLKPRSFSRGQENDTISRTMAIEALEKWESESVWDEWLYEHCNEPGCEPPSLIVKQLPSVKSEQRWVPCSERLPEDEYVLISKKPTKLSGYKWSVTIAIRMADPRSGKIHWRDIGFDAIQDDKVLAWMPLPKPYEGGEVE